MAQKLQKECNRKVRVFCQGHRLGSRPPPQNCGLEISLLASHHPPTVTTSKNWNHVRALSQFTVWRLIGGRPSASYSGRWGLGERDSCNRTVLQAYKECTRLMGRDGRLAARQSAKWENIHVYVYVYRYMYICRSELYRYYSRGCLIVRYAYKHIYIYAHIGNINTSYTVRRSRNIYLDEHICVYPYMRVYIHTHISVGRCEIPTYVHLAHVCLQICSYVYVYTPLYKCTQYTHMYTCTCIHVPVLNVYMCYVCTYIT